MTLFRTLALATALALPVTAVHVATANITAEAAGHTKKVKAAKKATAYKHCGTFMYRKDGKGKCLDARAKK